MRTAQAEHADSERRFDRLRRKGVTDYALYMLDPPAMVTSWNAGAERIKGYTADEILGENFARFYTPEDAAAGAPQAALATALKDGGFEAEVRHVRKDGRRFLAHVVIEPLYDDTGRHIGFAMITRDITERRRQDEALEQTRVSWRRRRRWRRWASSRAASPTTSTICWR